MYPFCIDQPRVSKDAAAVHIGGSRTAIVRPRITLRETAAFRLAGQGGQQAVRSAYGMSFMTRS
jgi:hypothetical protein